MARSSSAKSRDHVVRIGTPNARLRAAGAEIAAATSKIAALKEELRTCSVEVLHANGGLIESEINRLIGVVAAAQDRRFRIVHSIPEPAPEPKERPAEVRAAAATALPYDLKFSAEGAPDEELRADGDLINEFLSELRKQASIVERGAKQSVTYTQDRHLQIDMAIGVLRRWARAERLRGDALEARLAELEAAQTPQGGVGSGEVAYRGVHKDGETYVRGEFVTFGGSLWHCNAETIEKPVGGGLAWTLAVRKGRDAKPAQGAEPEVLLRLIESKFSEIERLLGFDKPTAFQGAKL